MRKSRSLLAVIALALASCAAQPPAPPAPGKKNISPEEDLGAPGMIPAECESVLQHSQEWGYRPGEKWKPQNLDQAKEVASFFAGFHMVPENTSRFYGQWMEKSVQSEKEAARSTSLLQRAQSCDPSFTMAFLDGILDYRWPRKEKKEASQFLLQFLVNQQARHAPLMTRAVSLHVLEKAKRKGFLAGPAKPVKDLQALLKNLDPAKEDSALEIEKSLRNEFKLSQSLREKMARFIPLP